MKKLILLTFCLLCTLITFSQFDMPSFKEVVREFYTKYSYVSPDSYLRFQRKKDGWYVAEENYYNQGNYLNVELFWSKKTRSYVNIDYPEAAGDTAVITENINYYLRQIDWVYEEYRFERNKYYGYPGWDWDVISDSADMFLKIDTLLESQGRAYSNYASGFIMEQYGDLFVNDDPDRIPLKPAEKISKTRINKFISYDLKSIDAFKKIIKINPDYETVVGNIKIKCANEYMFMYCELMIAGDLTNAKRFAGMAEYPDSLLKLGKSYLNAVPLHSILITNGDNDTYPLWYLQEIQKYRPDVIVLNNSLLGLRSYLFMLERKNSNKLFSTRSSTYEKNNFDYSVFGNEHDNNMKIDVSTFLKHLEKNHNPYDTSTRYYKNEVLRKYYSKNLFFGDGKLKKSKTISLSDYLLMNEYIILDILNTNPFRKVFFTFSSEIFKNVLEQTGDVYKVQLWTK